MHEQFHTIIQNSHFDTVLSAVPEIPGFGIILARFLLSEDHHDDGLQLRRGKKTEFAEFAGVEYSA